MTRSDLCLYPYPVLSAGSEREAKAGAGGGQLERAHQAAGGGERQAQVRGLLPQVGHFSWILAHLDDLRIDHCFGLCILSTERQEQQ